MVPRMASTCTPRALFTRLVCLCLLVCSSLTLLPATSHASDFTMSTVVARVTGVSRTLDEQTNTVIRSTVTQRRRVFDDNNNIIDIDEIVTECPGDRCYSPGFLTCPTQAHVLVIDDPGGAKIVTVVNCVPTTFGSCGHANGQIKAENDGRLYLSDGILYSSRGCS